MSDAKIELLEPDQLALLVEHMRRHAPESGSDGDPVHMPFDAAAPFNFEGYGERRGVAWLRRDTEPGWIRTFGLCAPGRVVGHVELRGGVVPSEGHRAELGMGLERAYRGRGWGRGLLEHAVRWARTRGHLAWIDLGVFSENTRALELYQRFGFRVVGRQVDRFRVNGRAIEDISMTLELRPERPASQR